MAPSEVRLIRILAGCMPFLPVVFFAMDTMNVFPQIVLHLSELFYDR